MLIGPMDTAHTAITPLGQVQYRQPYWLFFPTMLANDAGGAVLPHLGGFFPS